MNDGFVNAYFCLSDVKVLAFKVGIELHSMPSPPVTLASWLPNCVFNCFAKAKCCLTVLVVMYKPG